MLAWRAEPETFQSHKLLQQQLYGCNCSWGIQRTHTCARQRFAVSTGTSRQLRGTMSSSSTSTGTDSSTGRCCRTGPPGPADTGEASQQVVVYMHLELRDLPWHVCSCQRQCAPAAGKVTSVSFNGWKVSMHFILCYTQYLPMRSRASMHPYLTCPPV